MAGDDKPEMDDFPGSDDAAPKALSDSEVHRRGVLNLIQKDNRLTHREIGEEVKITAQSVSKIIKKANEDHTIWRNRAILNYKHFGAGNLFFIQVKLRDKRRFASSAALIKATPNVQEIHHTTGVIQGDGGQGLNVAHGAKVTVFDLIVKLRCDGNHGMDRFLERLRADPNYDDHLIIPVADTFRETTVIDLGLPPRSVPTEAVNVTMASNARTEREE
jgi:DNA-binding Lrp family transcriptional regulator